MRNTQRYIYEQVANRNLSPDLAKQMLEELQVLSDAGEEHIAIIGMSGRYPRSENIEKFWEKLTNGEDCVSSFPAHRREDINNVLQNNVLSLALYKAVLTEGMNVNDAYGPGGFLDRIDLFDAEFFSISAKEARCMEPHQRLLLESTYEALEDAGYGGESLHGSNTGVFIGRDHTDIPFYKLMAEPDLLHLTGSYTGILSSRISYVFNLKGPSVVVDTACSSGLVAIHEACSALRDRRCDTAIAGGVNLIYFPVKGDGMFSMITSQDSIVRTFDKKATGTVLSEGVGAVVLKPLRKALADRDNIQAVILTSVSNNDGASNGITAPSPEAQEELLMSAWKNAKINPETISYIEAHGTGTLIGDPIETKAIFNAMKRFTDKKQFCAIGSVKSNIGHTVAASGLAGVTKVVQALRHKNIPASINFDQPNPYIHFTDSPLYVNDKLMPWESDGKPRRGGISSFGFSGTNCHIVLEEAPELQQTVVEQWQPEIFTLSSQNESSLRELVDRYVEMVQRGIACSIQDLCYTANVGRGHYSYRLAFSVESEEDFAKKILEIGQFGLKGDAERGIYYGVTEPSEGMNLKQEADQRIALLRQSGQRSEPLKDLSELCQLYVRGAQVDWTSLYSDKQRRRVSIPVYAFNRKRYWAEVFTTNHRPQIVTADPTVPNECAFEMKWIPSVASKGTNRIEADKVTLVIQGETDLSKQIVEQLRKEGKQTVAVRLGSAYRRMEEDQYAISGSQEDYERLFAELPVVNRIIHLCSMDGAGNPSDVGQLNAKLARGVNSLFHIVRAMKAIRGRLPIDLMLVTDHVNQVTGRETLLKPTHAALIGLGKVVVKEYPEVTCRTLDIDDTFTVEQLHDEILIQESEIIAYRDGVRYKGTYDQVPLPAPKEISISLKEEGVYVITGGTGGLGLEFAKYFASKAKVNIALLSRKPFPEKNLWRDIIEQNEEDTIISKLIMLQEIEKIGGHVHILQADISDADGLSAALAELRSTYGRINGIIHAAGVASQGLIIRKSEDAFNEVLLPKIQGTWLLDQLTAKDPLEFFIMFSSAMTYHGHGGQGDYTAANSYMDAYAYYRKRLEKSTLTLNWPAWKETGMAVKYGFSESNIFNDINTKTAISLFESVLGADFTTVGIGSLNPRFIDEMKPQTQNNAVEVRLEGRMDGTYSDLEWKVAQVWGLLFETNCIKLTDDFFELGGHSLLAIKLEAELEELGYMLDGLNIEEHSTFEKFVAILSSKNSGLLAR
ncbi:SDR family oxidoreductase [Paenibacillus sp. RRE4]|uniref:type I polyketide synthase n=1 Tax=Paenibacillus sp. RRE4 TaxID=2962587 RepID=UPI00288217C8|nr:SDR family NAD(P)-dependent oxidoreductase [Paenibacillus sp. RRE4]MDT0125324.1 SDR family oxidoreductase [Paenibacillus sp. RRE4]